MNEIITFNFNNNTVRTKSIDGAAWFCLKDACVALGLSNSRKTKTQLTSKGVTESYTPTNGGEQEVTFINEPNLYRLIFRSNKPQAQAFADWVYEEVLPSIRQTGGYNAAPALDAKAIGGIVKKCAAKAVKDELAECRAAPFKVATAYERHAFVDEIKQAVKDALWETINPCILQGGLKKTPLHNGYVTADGLPPANWILGIIHGANALECCINRLVERQKDAVNLLEPKQ